MRDQSPGKEIAGDQHGLGSFPSRQAPSLRFHRREPLEAGAWTLATFHGGWTWMIAHRLSIRSALRTTGQRDRFDFVPVCRTPPRFWVETAQLPDFPRLTKDIDVEVLVVGGGMAGISAAYLLRKAGRRVALIESCPPGRARYRTHHRACHLRHGQTIIRAGAQLRS